MNGFVLDVGVGALRSKKEAMKYRFDLRSNFDGKS